MLKIAVAFFGIPRNSAICFPAIEENILARLPATATVRCFYHLYEISAVHNARSGEQGALDAQNYLPFESMSGVLASPAGVLERWDFERIKAFGDPWNDGHASLRNLILQLNSLHNVTEQMADFSPDFVIFARPDIEYLSGLPDYIFTRPVARSRHVYIPDWQWWGGLNDRFAVCGRETYQAYGKRIEQVLAFCTARARPLHAEQLLKFAMLRAGARICTLAMTAARVRIDGKRVEENFSRKRGMGKRENRYLHFFARLRTWRDRFIG